MLGFSVFLKNDLTDSDFERILNFKSNGFRGIFTSINLPEDDPNVLVTRLFELGEFCKNQKLDLTVDISSFALKRLNLSWDDLKSWKGFGISRLRMDDGLTMSDIAEFSNSTNVALNASTITDSDIEELKKSGADFSHLEAWHNYYPRRDTGLQLDWFAEKNRWLKDNGFKVMAFIPGNQKLRGPVYETLPTIETHRFKNPLFCAIELEKLNVDKIFLGDEDLADFSKVQFKKYFTENIMALHVKKLENAPSYFSQIFHQRPDISDLVIRLTEGRLIKEGKILQSNIFPRERGSIVLDNELASRYEGELQICKSKLPASASTNIIGYILPNDLDLLDYISANQAIQFFE